MGRFELVPSVVSKASPVSVVEITMRTGEESTREISVIDENSSLTRCYQLEEKCYFENKITFFIERIYT